MTPQGLEFMGWLEKQPAALARIATIFGEFLVSQGQTGSLPPAGGTVEYPGLGTLTTVGVTPEQLEAMANNMGEAVAKEKVYAFVKGFISGVMVAGG